MIKPSDVISYLQMCAEEGLNLQRGMNFKIKGGSSIILVNVHPGAPYADRVEESGRILIYEGHDEPNRRGGPDPKKANQPRHNPGGSLTQNGLFEQASKKFKSGEKPAEIVKVYEKIRPGIWVFNGFFKLVDAWEEKSGSRMVFKFRLELTEIESREVGERELDHNRIIPTSVKLEVWKRDGGKCITCGSKDNLHFDHIIPFSKGGSSLVAKNIQLLCARHNLEKKANIE